MMRSTLFLIYMTANLNFFNQVKNASVVNAIKNVRKEYENRYRRHEASSRSLQVIDPRSLQEVDPRSCKSGKGRTCSPSAKPSTAPSLAPTISHMPTISHQPSDQPSISQRPSLMPSPGPSPSPTVAPSDFPSPQPSDTPTQTPTISSPPTMLPSAMPSDKPSVPPTIAPTISSQPTITGYPSMSPSIDPNGFVDSIVTDADGNTGVESQCRRSIPSSASSVTDQLIVFDYVLSTAPGSDTYLTIDKIAAEVQRSMSTQFLNCIFDSTTDTFLTSAIASLPVDVVDTTFTNCSSDASAECFRVNAAFTSTIFYLNESRRRSLQNGTSTTQSDAITDPNVYESFSSALNSLFASGQLTTDIPSVLSTDFQGITNDESSPSPSPSDGSQSDKSLSSGAVAGSVIGTLIAVALIAALIAFAVVTIRHRNESSSKAVDVTQKDFNDLHDYDEDERDDRAMIDRSIIASDDGSFDSGYQIHEKPRTTAYVVNDDNESYNTRSFPATGPSFSERIRGDAQGPTFVKANEILYQLHEAEYTAEIDPDIISVDMNTGSTGRRNYDAPDTVQL